MNRISVRVEWERFGVTFSLWQGKVVVVGLPSAIFFLFLVHAKLRTSAGR